MLQPLEVSVLGPFCVRRADGDTVPLAVRKAQCLLAYLAVERRAGRDVIANLFWGDRNEDRARHNVRQVLSKIRAACGPVVDTTGDALRLDPARVAVDVERFLELARAQDEESLRECLDVYTGDLLEGTLPREPEFQDWLLRTRERLQRSACEALDRYVKILMRAGEHERAIAAINRRLVMDPACEPAHRNLMTALTRLGRRSDALRQYATCVESLQRELGAPPSAETRRLFEEIRAGGQESAPAVSAGGAHDRGSASETPRIAVLPFENLSGDSEDYFADGVTEDIITALSRFHSLQVIARGSCFVYKNKPADDQEIAEALGARYLVRGSVLRAHDRVRINVQLLDGFEGITVWGDRFDFEMTDVFLVQDRITATLVSTLAGRVEASQLEQARKASPRRLQAYDYLLRGKDYHHRFTAEDCALCIDMFNRAIDRDPDYAVAYAWLACGLGQAMVWGLDDHAALVDRSQAAAEHGLELDENESECHRVLAQVQLTRRDLSRALRHQERALFLNPNDDRSVCSMGEILSYLGRHEEAEQWVRKSLALNPYHPQRYWTHLARALLHLGRFREALDVLEQIGRPRQDDFAYAITACLNLGDKDALARNLEALRIAFPEFDGESFAAMQPYERAADRELIRGTLAGAGL